MRSLESRIVELEAQIHDQRRQRSTTESVECFKTPQEKGNNKIGDVCSPLPGSSQPLCAPPLSGSIGANAQTPITIRASSTTFPNVPENRIRGHRGEVTSDIENTDATEQGTAICNGPIFSDPKELTLIQTYLERVNPRYPFLHEETFLQWYHSWKNQLRSGDILPPEERWKSFFMRMAFSVSLLLSAQVSPEERRTSNVSGARFYVCCEKGSKDPGSILDRPFIFQFCIRKARSGSTRPSVSHVHDTCSSFSFVPNSSNNDIDNDAMLCNVPTSSVNVRASSP